MVPNDGGGLTLPNLVEVATPQLILPPGERANIEAERRAMLEAIEAEEAEYGTSDEDLLDDTEQTLAERVRHTVCRCCGHQRLCFLPARLCEKCLKKAAEAAGVPFPGGGGQVEFNRAQRRAARRKK